MKLSLPKLTPSIKGMVLLVIAVGLISIMLMLSKLVTDYHDPIEKVFYRGVIALILVSAIMVVLGKRNAFKTERPFAQIGRGMAGTVGICLVFWAYSLMPMTEVAALMFTAGFMTLLVSPFLLGERVGPYRWMAVLIGFVGAIIIARPNSEMFNAEGVFAALAAAFVGGALVAVFLRSLGKTDSAFTTVFYFLLIGTLMTAPYVMLYGSWIKEAAIIPLLGMGITGGLSLLIKTEAYRLAEASLLSPVHYTVIVWAVLFDITVWGLVPDFYTILGAVIIIAANTIILWRENEKKRAIENAA